MTSPLKWIPYVLGSGRSAQAISESLAILKVLRPELGITDPVHLKRGDDLAAVRRDDGARSLLCIANPHGLHAAAILAGEKAGFSAILCEKPVAVNLTEVAQLREVKVPTAVLHGYRQTWGVQTLKGMVNDGAFGEIIAIEGRYWQASTAEAALLEEKTGETKPGWKDEVRLAGEFDTYLDVGTHWVDAVSFLTGGPPKKIRGWKSYVNAASPHRDSHIQVAIDYPKGRAFGSISKTFHGATNHFELNIIGQKLSATWEFLRPDEIFIGEGRDRRVVTRKTSDFGAKHPPHHGSGWMEGYIEITSRLLDDAGGVKNATAYPTLRGNLPLLEAMLQTDWN